MKSVCAVMLCGIVAVLFIVGCATQEKKTADAEHPNFQQLCSKCHTLDRVDIAHKAVTKQEMKKIMEKMAKKPGSGIDLHNINDIVEQIY
ncbi:MAG: hypothetical protein AB1656_03145 [Candidatus Omnitrophota bacterium]